MRDSASQPSTGPMTRAMPGSDASALDSPPAATYSIDDLRVLYDVHGGELFRFALRLVGERGLAEEAVQETFLRAWRARTRWEAELGSVRTWLFAIARNVSIDLLRARAIRPRLDSSAHDAHGSGSDKDERTAAHGDPYDEILDGWMIEEGLRRIRDDQRVAIVETYVKGRPYAEVAAELAVPEGTLRTRVFYGLKALRLALEEMGWHV